MEVILSNGAVMLVDEIDIDLAHRYRWQVSPSGYATRVARYEGKRVSEYFHRVILDVPSGMQGDHINGNRLDNRRSNLRLATPAENARNIHGVRGATGRRGVERYPSGTYSSYLRIDGRQVRVGCFDSIDAADAAARAARVLHYGAFS